MFTIDKDNLMALGLVRLENAIKIDEIGDNTMKGLGIEKMPSLGNRSLDRYLFKKMYPHINYNNYCIHHTLDGWLVLIDRKTHQQIPHYGFIWLMKHKEELAK